MARLENVEENQMKMMTIVLGHYDKVAMALVNTRLIISNSVMRIHLPLTITTWNQSSKSSTSRPRRNSA
jgi:hypothetical protein